jgi:pimeloyl-ACP methyl ester carboxylesterase
VTPSKNSPKNRRSRIRALFALPLLLTIAAGTAFSTGACSTLELNRRFVTTRFAYAGVGEGTLALPSGQLHYFDGGRRDAPALILVHGFGFGALETWEKQLPELSRRYRVIAPDLYVFGKSRPRHAPTTAAEEADALVEMMDALKVKRAHVVGVSFGGYVSLQMSLRHPDRVNKLVLLDAAGLEPTPREKRRVAAHFPEVTDRALVALPTNVPALRVFLGKMFYKTRYFPDFVLRELLTVIGQSRDDKLRIAHEMHRPGGMLPEPALARVKAPTLLVWGRHDPVLLPEMGQRMARAIPGARLEWLEQSAHTGMLEEPARFNRLVMNFLL